MIELKNYEERLTKIFNKQAYDMEEILDLTEKGYTAPESIAENAILFVGINPSLGKGKEPKRGFYKDPLVREGKDISYFDKMKEVIKDLDEYDSTRKLAFASFDLLYFQDTDQKTVDRILKIKRGNEPVGVGFIWEQLQLSREILEAAAPKIIVVSNTKARHFMGFEREVKEGISNNEWMSYKFEFEKGLGTYRIDGNHRFGTQLKNTPVFFTSMLSGQRALDKGSYKRLVWHIDFVLKKMANG